MKTNQFVSNIDDLDLRLTEATDVDLHDDSMLIEKREEKKKGKLRVQTKIADGNSLVSS